MAAREGRAVFESLETRTMLAAPGDLDPTFGVGGKLAMTFPGWTYANGWDVAPRSDGSFVVAGGVSTDTSGALYLAHFLPDGSLDSGFGSSGVALVSPPGGFSMTAIAGCPDNKIVVAFTADTGTTVCLARFTAAGRLDDTFINYAVGTGPGSISNADLAVGADGKPVVGRHQSISAHRFTASGAVDTAFGTTGLASYPGTSSAEGGTQAVLVAPNGSIIVAGQPDEAFSSVAVARFTSTGAVDSSFGSSGITRLGAMGTTLIRLGLDSTGRVLVGTTNYTQCYAARLLPDGQLDRTFATNGIASIPQIGLTGYRPMLIDMVADSSGGLYMGGQAGTDFAIVHYTKMGTPDPAFGNSGLVTTSFGGQDDSIRALALLAGQRLIAVGFDGDPTTGKGKLAIAKYLLVSTETQAPTASLTAAPVTTSGSTSYSFTVTYRDNVAVGRSTIDGGDVVVLTPSGAKLAATLAGIDLGGNGTPRTATYRITPPGGAWDLADNGTYTITMQAGQVTDTSGNPVVAGNIGSFVVGIVNVTPPHAIANGRAVDMAYDSSGRLYAAYYDASSQTLKYTGRSAGGAWSASTTIDSATAAGQYLSLGIGPSGLVAVAYYDAYNADLKYAQYNGSGWDKITVDSVGRVGLYPSINFDASGKPVVSYYDKSHGDLKLAAWDGSKWVASTVDSSGDTGRYSSLVSNPSTGRWAISYENETGGLFRLAEQGKSGWAFTTVDDTQGGGGYTSLAFSSANQLGLSYYDSYNANLKYATRNTAGTWTVGTVASAGSVGMYDQLHFGSSGNTAEITFYNKTGDSVLNGAGTTPGAWGTIPLASGGGRELSVAYSSSGKRTLAWFDTVSVGLLVQDV